MSQRVQRHVLGGIRTTPFNPNSSLFSYHRCHSFIQHRWQEAHVSGMLLGPESSRTSMVRAPGAQNRIGKTIKCVGHRILRKNAQLSQLNENKLFQLRPKASQSIRRETRLVFLSGFLSRQVQEPVFSPNRNCSIQMIISLGGDS